MRPLVIVPTYNERANLPPLLDQLLALPAVRILVFYDASPDGTGQVADDYASRNRARIQVLHRSGKRGLGLSYIDGMYVALRTDATHICQMDADLSHSPTDIPRLLDAAGEADFVIGSRYVRGGRIENWPLHRRLLSAFANRYIRAITRMTIRDCTSGFRCWRRDARGAALRGSAHHVRRAARGRVEAVGHGHHRVGDRAVASRGASQIALK